MRAGLVVLLASFAAHAGNYLYYLVAGRMLGPAGFAEVSALIALALLVFVPFNGVQAATARDGARYLAAGDSAGFSAHLRRLSAVAALVCAGVTFLLLVGIPAFTRVLAIDDIGLLVAAAIWTGSTAFLVVWVGAAQGLQRFGVVAVQLAGPLGVLRVLLLPLGIVAFGIAGAMWAMVTATAIGLVLAAVVLWPWLGRRRDASSSGRVRIDVSGPLLGLLGFAVLTNADILVAKASLEPTEAGVYAAAALLGKIALYAPQALSLVLLPAAVARLEKGESATHAVLATLAATAGSGLVVVAVLALSPRALLAATFGEEFLAGQSLLVPLAIVMTAAALINVHLTFALARRDQGFTRMLVCAAVLQLILLSVLNDSAGQIVTASALTCGITLLGYEVLSRHGVVRLIRASAAARRSGSA